MMGSGVRIPLAVPCNYLMLVYFQEWARWLEVGRRGLGKHQGSTNHEVTRRLLGLRRARPPPSHIQLALVTFVNTIRTEKSASDHFGRLTAADRGTTSCVGLGNSL